MELSTIFTGVIAVATVAYTYFAHKLWKATRAQADIARYTAAAALLQTLAAQAEKQKAGDPRSAALLEAFLALATEVAFKRMAEDINLKKDREAREYFRQVEGMLRANGIDPSSVSWMKPLLKQLE